MRVKIIICAFIYFLILATLALAVMGNSEAEQSIIGDNIDLLGQSMFGTEDSAFMFSNEQDTNFDSVTIGDDEAIALGVPCKRLRSAAKAQNEVQIKKDQNSGTPRNEIDNCSPCSVKYNLEHIEIGDRDALAIGSASAVNHIKIVANQQ